jgi:hypothetical protein
MTMVATPLSPSQRYFPPGTRAVYWVPTIADIDSPTRGELDAGTDLTGEISAMAGFSVTSATISTPDLGTRFAPDIPGQITATGSSITLYMSEDSTDVRELMPRDSTGFVVILWEGDQSGRKMDVYPVTVTSAPKDSSTTSAATITVDFAVTSEPAENITIPGS